MTARTNQNARNRSGRNKKAVVKAPGSGPESLGQGRAPASRSLEGALDRLTATAAKRRKKKVRAPHPQPLQDSLRLGGPESEHAPAVLDNAVATKKRRGMPSPELVRQAELRIVEREQLGLFDSFPVQPGNEFPTLLARLPIFPAVARARQKKLLDADNALPFETPFGKGRRHGPPVTVEDEDCLIALIRLRQRRLVGQGGKLPIPIGSPHFTDSADKVSVHVVCCTLSQVLAEMGQCDSGRNFQRALQAFKRLAAMVIEVETRQADRYFGPSTKGTSFKLVDIVWEAFETQGLILAQFPPVVVNWLENHASYIQWDVRRKLTGRNARALHRFLSTQPRTYAADMVWLAQTIGWEGDKRRMRSAFQTVLQQFMDLQWLERYEISGTGRRVPHRIHIWRH